MCALKFYFRSSDIKQGEFIKPWIRAFRQWLVQVYIFK